MMTDPIADMLTRIRNAAKAKQAQVVLPSSRIKLRIAKILEEEGFVGAVEELGEKDKKSIVIKLKYTAAGKPQIVRIRRMSRLGLRLYLSKDELKALSHKRGVTILSTSKGVLKDSDAKKAGVGGELLCTVW